MLVAHQKQETRLWFSLASLATSKKETHAQNCQEQWHCAPWFVLILGLTHPSQHSASFTPLCTPHYSAFFTVSALLLIGTLGNMIYQDSSIRTCFTPVFEVENSGLPTVFPMAETQRHMAQDRNPERLAKRSPHAMGVPWELQIKNMVVYHRKKKHAIYRVWWFWYNVSLACRRSSPNAHASKFHNTGNPYVCVCEPSE